MAEAMAQIDAWFAQRGQTPFAFQRQTWAAYAAGLSGLVHAPTGLGKTLAVWLGPVLESLAEPPPGRGQPWPLRVLWLTPLRALARDTLDSLREPVEALQLPWSSDMRTGDVSSTRRARQLQRLPSVLVTTPESASVLLSHSDARARFADLRCVVVDEWHELLGSKRGTMTQLVLARLRRWRPDLRTWGVSATLGNLDLAKAALLGDRADQGVVITGREPKTVRVDTLLPPEGDDILRFPWSGHLGLRMLPQVLGALAAARTTLLFTNTRSQAEIWFAAILEARPEWLGEVALHHGSLDRKVRQEVEALVHDGRLRCVVCTSSLDLGVDFSPVDQVLQLGSPKGVARLMQRAGRSGHQPGGVSRVLGVPTHAMELVEFAAAREAMSRGEIEPRVPPGLPLDVLAQHLVTVAMGGGFEAAAMYDEVRTAHAFADLTPTQWQWCLDFIARGGPTLHAYPEYARVIDDGGVWRIASPRIARMHRMSIGTITSDAAVSVRWLNGRTLGTVEESFISRLKRGDRFVFGGHLLELVQYRNLVASVRRGRGRKATVPRWGGGRTPLSTQLADSVQRELVSFTQRGATCPELAVVAPMLALQQRWSVLPSPDELLIETARTRDGEHHFLFPFAGHAAHEGLGALLAHRLTRHTPRSVAVVANDYGLELLTPDALQLTDAQWRELLTTDRLLDDLLACVNASQLARRQFREIARIAGLVFTGFPGQGKSNRQLQASSELFFDVFSEFDPDNMLLDQARREVLDQQLEVTRLSGLLSRLATRRLTRVATPRLTPMAFPLWAEHLREQHVSTEAWSQRVQRAAMKLEQAARTITDDDDASA